jgi:hypothetical protein
MKTRHKVKTGISRKTSSKIEYCIGSSNGKLYFSAHCTGMASMFYQIKTFVISQNGAFIKKIF